MKQWHIYPIEKPSPDCMNGQWYGFCEVGNTEHHGHAHETTLSAYVGEKQAAEAIRNYRGRSA